ncbi:amino acid permease [Paenibacillus sambharensis]|uniref:Amino acid permease n=1 Tax=Paenibacillus sambharensis TaxID=1803190 RepID=A0A2W1LIL1_9BACL|nr:amino acid permease [Paenibacillus sambharensis]PZD94902.1 amino acid permease [Paenibacillus sambharensis]
MKFKHGEATSARAHNNPVNKEDKLHWWQLSLLGVAFTIGTGYFLGSGIAIKIGGPGVLIAFVFAGFGTYIVFDVLARMTSEDPLEGSFRSYAKKAFGRWAGFTSGWVYWASELLIMGSQMTALSLFSRFWFPDVPMWLFASGYAILGLIIILLGTKGFERFENVFAIIKVSAIVMFLIIATAALMGWIGTGRYTPSVPGTAGEYFPHGFIGLWSALLFAFYAFGGIEIMGIMAMRLQDPKQAPKAGKMMLMLLTTIYIASIILAITLVPWNTLNAKKSPFLTALDQYNLPLVPHIFNAVLIIAGFSTMVASLFAVTTMLVTLAQDKDAPVFFAKKVLKGCPLPAIGLTTAGLIASIISALLMPGKIYEYVTTAAGLMLLYNWFFILVTSGKLLKLSKWAQAKRFTGMLILLTAVSGSLFHETSRPGFYVSFAFVALIGSVTLLMMRHWKKTGGHRTHIASAGGESEHKIIGMDYKLGEEKTKRLNAKVRSKTD